jgi:hypothetical protein
MPIRRTLSALLLAIAALPAYAQRDPLSGAPLQPGKRPTPSPITDHLYVGVSFFDPRLSTFLRIDPTPATNPPTTGTPLSGERNLGFAPTLQQAKVEAMLRLRERFRIRVGYFEADRSGSVVLPNTIVFGNQTFAAGDQLNSSLDWRMFTVSGLYSFYRTDRLEIATGISAYAVQLQAQALAPLLFQQQTTTASGAVPALPLDITWRFARYFSFTARGAYFKAAHNDFSGSLTDLYGDLQYRIVPNLTFGVSYSGTKINLTRNSLSSSPGIANLSIKGPQAFLRFSF